MLKSISRHQEVKEPAVSTTNIFKPAGKQEISTNTQIMSKRSSRIKYNVFFITILLSKPSVTIKERTSVKDKPSLSNCHTQCKAQVSRILHACGC